MIKSTDAYKAAIVGDSRRIYLRAAIDIIDPDIVYGEVKSTDAAPWSKPDQVYDKELAFNTVYATLERNRWVLDGSAVLIPDDPEQLPGQVGYVGNTLSGDDGSFSSPVYVSATFSNVSILQSCSVYFSTLPIDGVPSDFTVDIIQGGTSYHTETFTGNTATSVTIKNFTVYNPDTIKVTITKWSLPGRRVRIPEIIPGVHEEWDSSILASFQVAQQANVNCLSLPYGVCTLRMDNLDRRFEPRSKTGLFQSIEDRQSISVNIGVQLDNGSVEYKQVGVYYQYSGGWKTGDNDITMQWSLVDIIGLIVDRDYIVPETLPTTLEGWVASVVAQLGTNFTKHYAVDTNYASIAITCTSDKVQGKKCGDILRWACMATGTWPRADAETGFLAVEPLWSEGNKLTLDNMVNYPVMRANEDIAALIFTLNDGNNTQYIVSGTSAGSPNTVTVENPFIQTQEQALVAARQILSTYGGNKLETVGRGDPTSEIGDVDTVWLDESQATTGRRIYQTFTIQDGVLQNCQSTLLQADGSFLFQANAVITESGTWTAPAGASRLRVIIGQGGQGGMRGQAGTVERGKPQSLNVDTGEIREKGTYNASYGADGTDGLGGKIWFGTIDINEQQQFEVHIGKGGAPSSTYGVAGAEGEETTFGAYSSAAGQIYPNGFTDVASGDSYGRTGVPSPVAGSSDGAKGGKGGAPGVGEWEKASMIIEGSGRKIYYSWFRVKVKPGEGDYANAGGNGFVAVYWDKED